VDWDSVGGGVWVAFLVKCGLLGVYYVVICSGFFFVKSSVYSVGSDRGYHGMQPKLWPKNTM